MGKQQYRDQQLAIGIGLLDGQPVVGIRTSNVTIMLSAAGANNVAETLQQAAQVCASAATEVASMLANGAPVEQVQALLSTRLRQVTSRAKTA